MLDKNERKGVNNYLKFSALAFQMGVLITAAALGGNRLDEKQTNKYPIWTILLVLIAIFASLYQIIREVIKMGKQND